MRRKNRKGFIRVEAIPSVAASKLVADEAEMRASIAPEPRSLTVGPSRKSPQTTKPSAKQSRRRG